MNLKTIIVFLSIIFMNTILTQAQSPPSRKYVTIIVEGVNGIEDAKTIDDFLRSQPGVSLSRMDFRTKKYFGVYRTSSGITLDNYKSWITNLGFTVKCGRTGTHGIGNTSLIKREECETKLASPIKTTNP